MGKSVARVTTPRQQLFDGDRMASDEFLRLYEADPVVVRAELINGVVYVNAWREVVDGKEVVVSPIGREGHGRPQANVIGWLTHYSFGTPGVACSAPSTVQMSDKTAAEPDALLWIEPAQGGRTTPPSGDDITGAPELVVEVSNTSASRDLGTKFDAYQQDGVKEYIVWRTGKEALDWFVLRRGKFAPLVADSNGWLRSEAFPGLWLDVPSLLAGDMAQVIRVLQQGLGSPGHAAFVAKLAAAKAKRKTK